MGLNKLWNGNFCTSCLFLFQVCSHSTALGEILVSNELHFF